MSCSFLSYWSHMVPREQHLRDWSLITGRGGGYKIGKSRVRNFLRPPPQDKVKLFTAPLLKSGNFLHPPPYNMAKTSSYCVRTTPKLLRPPPPSAWLKLCPPPLFIGVKLHVAPPSRFVPPPLSVLSDQSLTTQCILPLRSPLMMPHPLAILQHRPQTFMSSPL